MAEKLVCGIDISRWQNKPDFAKVKKDVDFVIMQAGFGRYSSQKDAEFERNYSECRKYGIPCGAYWFSYASTPEEAGLEAAACIQALKGKKLEYPVYYDIEGAACSGDVSGKCRAFCSALEKAGWFAGIYISRSPAETYLDGYCREKFALWLAEYGGKLNWSGAVGMWQNSSAGRVAGISGDVDTDVCYEDYPALIKAGGFNGFEKEKPQPAPAGKSVLDGSGFRKGDKGLGVYALKQMLMLAGVCGLTGQKLDDNGSFGEGTEKAVNRFLSSWGYGANGTAGERFMKKLREEMEREMKEKK